MHKLTEDFIAWCKLDTASARFERSVAQAVIGLVCAAASSWAGAPEWFTVAVAPTVMAVLAPVQKAIANNGEVDR